MTTKVQWSAFLEHAAKTQGWNLVSVKHTDSEKPSQVIQRNAESTCFDNDAEAIAHVIEFAGSCEACEVALALCDARVLPKAGDHDRRIRAAIAACAAWQDSGCGDRANRIRDLIADLCHFAEFIGRHPSDEVDAAMASFEVESRETQASGRTKPGVALTPDDLGEADFTDLIGECVAAGEYWRPSFVFDDKGAIRDTREHCAQGKVVEHRTAALEHVLSNYAFDPQRMQQRFGERRAREISTMLASLKH
jgi:hypothetical protein